MIKVKVGKYSYEYVRVVLKPDVANLAFEICRDEGLSYRYPSDCIQYIIHRYAKLREKLNQ